jgi:GntR family transcriptional regulator / MocR family aminotransferase
MANECKNPVPMDLHLDLASAPGRSRRARLEYALRDAVRGGRVAPGARLPSTRTLCVELGVSRGMVADVYAQLAAEGYLRTRRGAGTTVAATGVEERASRPGVTATPAVRHDMSPFRPALCGFPRAAWLAATARVLRSVPDERLAYPDPAGTPELRETLAAYLGRVRGVRADSGHVVVTNGLRQGIDLLWGALAAGGARRLAVEDPGWGGLRDTARAAGLRVVPVSVDRDGLVVDCLEKHREIDVVAVAPAHQYPTGAVLSPSRRAALQAWARRHDALIVEDDYDAEYRYDRRPVGSLQGLAPEYVVYGGSTSKTLAPAVRLGWLVLPRGLVGPVAALQRLRGGMPAPLQQLVLSDLIERGELDRHLRRWRRHYRCQRDMLLAALAARLPEVTIHGAAAGLYVVLGLPDGLDERVVLAAARSRGVALEGLGTGEPAIAVGYANLTDAAIAPAVAALAESIEQAQRADTSSQSGGAYRGGQSCLLMAKPLG